MQINELTSVTGYEKKIMLPGKVKIYFVFFVLSSVFEHRRFYAVSAGLG